MKALAQDWKSSVDLQHPLLSVTARLPINVSVSGCSSPCTQEAIVSWGVAEANELGICRLLKEKCAHEVPHVEAGSGLRDLKATTLQQLHLLSFPTRLCRKHCLRLVVLANVDPPARATRRYFRCRETAPLVIRALVFVGSGSRREC